MKNIKSIDDIDLQNDDIVRGFCKKCNKQKLFKITILDDGIIGQCSSCREFYTFKTFHQKPSKPIVTCPYCQSTNTNKIGVVNDN